MTLDSSGHDGAEKAVFIACESTVGRNGAEMAAQAVEMKEAGARVKTLTWT